MQAEAPASVFLPVGGERYFITHKGGIVTQEQGSSVDQIKFTPVNKLKYIRSLNYIKFMTW